MPKSHPLNELYLFDNFRLDVPERALWRGDQRVPLPERAFETLCVLVRHGNRLVSKDQLMNEVWKDTVVEENNLAKSVSALRKILGERADGASYIETVRGHGFRFRAEVSAVAGTAGRLDATQDADSELDHPVAAASEPTAGQGWSRLWLVSAAIAMCAGLGFFGIQAWRDTPPGGPITSIAVLPFGNVGGGRELDYLSDGLSEALIDRLSALPQLRVIARSSSFRYRGGNVDLQEAARALGVEAVVTGRVVRRDDALWIRVELSDARDNKQLWGAEFNRRPGDAFLASWEITRIVADKMRPHLAGAPQQGVERETANPQVYEPLLRGNFFLNAGGTENVRKAVDAYLQAIAIDPTYALAHAKLSESYGRLLGSGTLDPRTFAPLALSAAQRASELDPGLAEAQLELANQQVSAWNWAEAEARFRRAIELNPNLALARRNYSAYLSIVGRHDEALVEATRTRDLDPLTLSNHGAVAFSLFAARRYDEAIAEYEKVIAIDGGQIWGHAFLGHSYRGRAMFREAIAAYQEAIRLGDSGPSLQIALGSAYAHAGDQHRARAILESLVKPEGHVAPGELAVLYISLGERERAFALLDEAHALHDLQLQYLHVEPEFALLRNDPRYAALLERIGLAMPNSPESSPVSR